MAPIRGANSKATISAVLSCAGSVSLRFVPGLTTNMHGRRCDPVIWQTKLYDTPSDTAVRNHPDL